MFSSPTAFSSPSRDFITLCQSQVTLLTQGFKADWSAVYATEASEDGTQTHLIPIIVYPQTEAIWKAQTSDPLLPDAWNDIDGLLSFPMTQSLEVSNPHLSQPKRVNEDQAIEINQLVLPLIHQDIVVGLLVTARQHYPWQPEELSQVEKIAKTLAIARLLDQRQGWYQQQLNQQQTGQRQERDRLDDLFHQLRNPLTALRIFSKLLLKRLHSDEKSRTITENIVREGEHLQDLLQEFEANQEAIAAKADIVTLNTEPIAFSKATFPSLPPGKSLSLESVNVSDVLESLLISAQPIAQEKEIDLTAEIPGGLSPVRANFLSLREVFSNLISNAIKYTPQGGKVRVIVGLSGVRGEEKYQGIAIEDTGYGIPLEDQGRIFERHYRGVQSQGEIAGSGLGLAIAQDLVHQMQGIIEVLSPTDERNNQGTKFIVWLPLYQ